MSKKVLKLSDEEIKKNIEHYCSGNRYVIKTALQTINAVLSEERKALDTLGTLEKFELLSVTEISKKEREFVIKYMNSEKELIITYGFRSGDQWVKDISKNYE